MVVLRVAAGVRRHFMYRLPEWALSANLALFSVVLLMPGDTFGSVRTYAVMARIADERTWGVAIGIVASVRLISLILNGTFPVFARYSPLARAIGSALGAIVWFALSVSFYESNPTGTGWSNYAVWLAVDVVLAVHIAGEAGQAWKARHGDGA